MIDRTHSPFFDAPASPEAIGRARATALAATLLADSLRAFPTTVLWGGTTEQRTVLIRRWLLPLLARRTSDGAVGLPEREAERPAQTPPVERERSSAEAVVVVDQWPDASPLPSLEQRVSAARAQAADAGRVLLVLLNADAALEEAAHAFVPDRFWSDLVARVRRRGAQGAPAHQGASAEAARAPGEGWLPVQLLLVIEDPQSAGVRWLRQRLPMLGERTLSLNEPAPFEVRAMAIEPVTPPASGPVEPSFAPRPAGEWVGFARPQEPEPSAPVPMGEDWLDSLNVAVRQVTARSREDGRQGTIRTPQNAGTRIEPTAGGLAGSSRKPAAAPWTASTAAPVPASPPTPAWSMEPEWAPTVGIVPTLVPDIDLTQAYQAQDPAEQAQARRAFASVGPAPDPGHGAEGGQDEARALWVTEDSLPHVPQRPPAGRPSRARGWVASAAVVLVVAAAGVAWWRTSPESFDDRLAVDPPAAGPAVTVPAAQAPVPAGQAGVAQAETPSGPASGLVAGVGSPVAEAQPASDPPAAVAAPPSPQAAAAPRTDAAPAPAPATPPPLQAASPPAIAEAALPNGVEPGEGVRRVLGDVPLVDLRRDAGAANAGATGARLAIVRADALANLPGRGLEVVTPLFVEPIQAWVLASSGREHWSDLGVATVDVGRGADAATARALPAALFGLPDWQRTSERWRALSDAQALSALYRREVDAVLRVGAPPWSAGTAAAGVRTLSLDSGVGTGTLKRYLPTPVPSMRQARTPGVVAFLVVQGGDEAARDQLAGQALQSLCAGHARLRAAAPREAWLTPGSSLPAGRPYAAAARREAAQCASARS